ncbi:heat shock protein HSP20 family protein [Ceratobasidium sp. AG-Ba]|nr:heat shock protein HSP20 family protein [Ceratobasidium sp. AG-Ba]
MSLARNFFEFEPMLRLSKSLRALIIALGNNPTVASVKRTQRSPKRPRNTSFAQNYLGSKRTTWTSTLVTMEGSASGVPSPQASQTKGNATQEITQGSEQSGAYEYRSTFSRTVWLPHAVDGSKASGKLVDGVLTLDIPKRDEPGRQKISLM